MSSCQAAGHRPVTAIGIDGRRGGSRAVVATEPDRLHPLHCCSPYPLELGARRILLQDTHTLCCAPISPPATDHPSPDDGGRRLHQACRQCTGDSWPPRCVPVGVCVGERSLT